MKHIITLLLLFPLFLFSQVQIGQAIFGEAINDRFGSSVSLSSNGNIIAISAMYNDGNGEDSGHVRVFENQSGSWVQIGQDIDGEAVNDRFGSSVSLSSNGNIIAIGGISNDDSAVDSGHVRVYENQSGSWIQIGQDIDGEGLGDLSGSKIDLSNEGNIVAISAPRNNSNGTWAGQVKVYENQSNNWIQIGQNLEGENQTDRFGSSISLSSNGNIVAIGAMYNNGNGEDSGHVRVYENQSGSWIQIGQDIDGESAEDFSGSSVSLSSNGNIVAIGAMQNSENGFYSGHVRVYENQSGSWIQIGQDIDGESVGDFSGSSVSLSLNGNIVAVGAPGNDSNGVDSGLVRVFDLSSVLSVDENSLIKFNLFPNPASTSIKIEVPKNLDIKTIAIYNNLGQLVTTTTKSILDVSSLSSGLYLVEIETIEGRTTKKLIIE